MIDGTDYYSEGIINRGGKLINHGVVNLINLEGYSYQNNKMIQGKGNFLIDGLLANEQYLAHEK